MLGISRVYNATFTAVVMCHCLCIPRSSYLLALEQYPSARAAKELMQAQKMVVEETRIMTERTIARKKIWQRYQNILVNKLRQGCPKELLQRCCHEWHHVAQHQIEVRKRNEFVNSRRAENMNDWLQRTMDGRKRVERQRRMRELIKYNIENRGPLVLPDWENSTSNAVPQIVTRDEHHTDGASCIDSESSEVVTILKKWPHPRPSPHYDLRLWNVLCDTLEDPPVKYHTRFQLPQI